MVYCWVPFCKSTAGKTKNVSFHEIPSDSALREKWLKVISRKDVPGPGGGTVICSLHFTPEDFDPNRKQRVLLKGTVPSNFPGYPKYMQPPKKKPRLSSLRRNCLIEKNCPAESKSPNLQKISQVNIETSQNECCHKPDFQEINEVAVETSLNECNYKNPTADVSTQADFIRKQKNKEVQLLKRRLKKYRKSMEAKNTEIKCLQHEICGIKNNPWYIKYQDIFQKAAEGDVSSLILLDQIKHFNLSKAKWSETTIRFSTIIRNCSPKCYDVIRANKILRLPCHKTLVNYTSEMEGGSFNDKAKMDEPVLEDHQPQLVANEIELAIV